MSITDIFITQKNNNNRITFSLVQYARLLIKRHDLAVLHPGHTGGLHLLVLALVVSDNMAQIGALAGGDIVRSDGAEADPTEKIKRAPVSTPAY